MHAFLHPPDFISLFCPFPASLLQIRLIRSGVEISTTDESKKTTAPAPASPSGRMTTANPSLGPITVKDHVPSEVYTKMETALEALKKVVNRQVEGFAVNWPDFENCVKEVSRSS